MIHIIINNKIFILTPTLLRFGTDDKQELGVLHKEDICAE